MISINNSPVPHLQTVWEWDTFIKSFYIPRAITNVMEIGSFFGATLWSLVVNNPSLQKILSLDLPIPHDDARYPQMITSQAKWRGWSDKIHELKGDSHTKEMVGKSYRHFPERNVDLLFIDGDHSYEGVREDYQMYEGLVKKGGLIVLHDSVGYDSVAKLCTELRAQPLAKYVEINEKNGWGLFILEK